MRIKQLNEKNTNDFSDLTNNELKKVSKEEIKGETLTEATYKIFIDDKLYASPKGSVMALRAQCGNITGFPSSSASTVKLASDLLDDGHADTWFKGKKVRVTLQVQESQNVCESMQSRWQSGAKMIRSGDITLVRNSNGVHSVMKGTKEIDKFWYDDGPADAFVVSGKRGEMHFDDIDELLKYYSQMKESVESVLNEASLKGLSLEKAFLDFEYELINEISKYLDKKVFVDSSVTKGRVAILNFKGYTASDMEFSGYISLIGTGTSKDFDVNINLQYPYGKVDETVFNFKWADTVRPKAIADIINRRVKGL